MPSYWFTIIKLSLVGLIKKINLSNFQSTLHCSPVYIESLPIYSSLVNMQVINALNNQKPGDTCSIYHILLHQNNVQLLHCLLYLNVYIKLLCTLSKRKRGKGGRGEREHSMQFCKSENPSKLAKGKKNSLIDKDNNVLSTLLLQIPIIFII